jgi:hypothetical protein
MSVQHNVHSASVKGSILAPKYAQQIVSILKAKGFVLPDGPSADDQKWDIEKQCICNHNSTDTGAKFSCTHEECVDRTGACPMFQYGKLLIHTEIGSSKIHNMCLRHQTCILGTCFC